MLKESFPFEEGVRRRRVRQLFLAQYSNKLKRPTATDVRTFCGWLVGHYPHLLPGEKQGDLYQHLKADLHDLYATG